MSEHAIWTYLHILLFVYWLGADLGVLILARGARRHELALKERLLLLHYATLIDLLPRYAFALMFPVGLMMSEALGLSAFPAWAVLAVWGIAAVWALLIHLAHAHEGKPLGRGAKRVQYGLRAVLFLATLGAGLASLQGHGPFLGDWLALKIILFSLVFPLGVLIDLSFQPLFPALGRLGAEGSTPAIEAAIARAIDGAIFWVLLVYLTIAAIAFLGVAKPVL